MTIASSRCRRTSASRREPALQAGAPKTMAGIPSLLFPRRIPDPDMHHWSLGSPAAVWPYRDANGGRLCFIGRYNEADGEKEFRPRTWCKNRETGREEWRWKNAPPPRPLYGLELLAARPDAPVMVVEGEGKCDVARRIFPDHVVISPMNGARSPQLADWSPLQGRDVTICRDNDMPGEAFEKTVGRILLVWAAMLRRSTLRPLSRLPFPRAARPSRRTVGTSRTQPSCGRSRNRCAPLCSTSYSHLSSHSTSPNLSGATRRLLSC